MEGSVAQVLRRLPVISKDQAASRRPVHAMGQFLAQIASEGLSAMLYDDGALVVFEPHLAHSTALYQRIKSEAKTHGITITDSFSASEAFLAEQRARCDQRDLEEDELSVEEKLEAQRKLEELVTYAVQHGCSDIHIYARSTAPMVRFRRNGEIVSEMLTPTASEIVRVVSRAFSWEGSENSARKIYDTSVPDSTRFDMLIPVKREGGTVKIPVTLRLEKGPLVGRDNVKCTIRVIASQESKSLGSLGAAPDVVRLMSGVMRNPAGLIIVSGPTGSGKSTFMHGCLHYLADGVSCHTIEDPVELVASYNPLIAQTPVNENLSYAEQLKSLMRHDPDCVVIGEMRDEETAKIAVRAALTGHKVLTTLHASNSIAVVTRLLDLNVNASDLVEHGVLAVVIAVRLVPLLCQYCSRPIGAGDKEDPEYALTFKNSLAKIESIRVRGPGCKECFKGAVGRVSVAEYIVVDDVGRALIKAKDLRGWREHLQKQGWKTLQDIVWDHVNAGRVDPVNADKHIGDVLTDRSISYVYGAAHA